MNPLSPNIQKPDAPAEKRAYIERDCTIEHNGDTHLVAYPAENGVLQDWHGNAIGTWRVVSSRPTIFFGHRSYMADRYYYMRAVVNGRTYALRGFGVGMLARGKAGK